VKVRQTLDTDALREFCLALPGTTETVQWGNDLVFKVGGKMYAVVALEPSAHWMSFKCGADTFAELIERQGIVPAPYLAKAQWVALESNRILPAPELKALVRTAYDIIVAKLPKKTQQALGTLASAS
jgi:predicted DNA-binding protein (MmcQ/YjbR family)